MSLFTYFIQGHSNEQYFIENAFGFVDGTQKLIISGSEDGKIYIWEAESGNLILKKNINPNNNGILNKK